MGGIIRTVVGQSSGMLALKLIVLLVGFLQIVRGQDTSLCSVTEAEACLKQRQEAYDREMNTSTSTTSSLQTLCLSQITMDTEGRCFETKTVMCQNDAVASLVKHWSDLNTNITQLCKSVCPNFLEVTHCTNMSNTNALASGEHFEDFCESFNESLSCANTALSNCEFGTKIYYAVQQRTAVSTWNNICNAGCQNLDESIAEFKRCAKYIRNSRDKTVLCQGYEKFTTCITTSTKACDNIWAVVLAKIPNDKILKKLCATTTSTTSTTTTTTTTTTTATPPSVSSTMEEQTVTPSDVPPLNISVCLTSNNLSFLETDQKGLSKENITAIFEFDTCLHKLASNSSMDVLHQAISTLSERFQMALLAARQRYGQLMTKECAQQTKQVRNSGCSGHEYGFLPCYRSGSFRCGALLSFVYLVIISCFHLVW